jgi:hypothetical protein
MGVSAGRAAGVSGWVPTVVTGWRTGEGDDCVHPANRRRAMRRIRIPVLKGFMRCIVYGRTVMCCGGIFLSPFGTFTTRSRRELTNESDTVIAGKADPIPDCGRRILAGLSRAGAPGQYSRAFVNLPLSYREVKKGVW